jgi:hypothetical protein
MLPGSLTIGAADVVEALLIPPETPTPLPEEIAVPVELTVNVCVTGVAAS